MVLLSFKHKCRLNKQCFSFILSKNHTICNLVFFFAFRPFRREVNDGTLKPFQKSFNASLQAARDHVDTLLQTPGENVNTVLATVIEEIKTARKNFNTWLQTPRENVNTLMQTPREHANTLLQTARENVNTLLQTAIENVNSKEINRNEELYEWVKKEKKDLREKDIESPWVRDDQDEEGSDEVILMNLFVL